MKVTPIWGCICNSQKDDMLLNQVFHPHRFYSWLRCKVDVFFYFWGGKEKVANGGSLVNTSVKVFLVAVTGSISQYPAVPWTAPLLSFSVFSPLLHTSVTRIRDQGAWTAISFTKIPIHRSLKKLSYNLTKVSIRNLEEKKQNKKTPSPAQLSKTYYIKSLKNKTSWCQSLPVIQSK